MVLMWGSLSSSDGAVGVNQTKDFRPTDPDRSPACFYIVLFSCGISNLFRTSANKTFVVDVFSDLNDMLNMIRDSSFRCSQRIKLLPKAKASYLTCLVCAGMWDISVEAFVFEWALEESQDKGSLLHN